MNLLLADRNPDAEAALREAGATDLAWPEPGESLPAAVARVQPDVVILDALRPDRAAELRRITAGDPQVIVTFVDPADPASLDAALALVRRVGRMQAALHHAEAALQERRAVDRAKSVLIRTKRMTEPEAYGWLRRRAMDSGRRIADVAAELVAGPG